MSDAEVTVSRRTSKRRRALAIRDAHLCRRDGFDEFGIAWVTLDIKEIEAWLFETPAVEATNAQHLLCGESWQRGSVRQPCERSGPVLMQSQA